MLRAAFTMDTSDTIERSEQEAPSMIAAGAAPAAKPVVPGERLGYSVALGVGVIAPGLM
jgi:hypothetical protein